MPPPDEPQLPRFTAWANACVERDGRKFFRGASASSPFSEDDARQRARSLARERAEAIAAGVTTPPPQSGGYPYPQRVLVEPVIERILAEEDGDVREIARVTENNYAAKVLNAYSVMFVDVDTLADTSNAGAEIVVSQAEALDALVDLVHLRPELTFRVYATRAGLRYLCTSRHFDPVSPESEDILRRLKADKRYALLCRVQKCYRARLSPKPWRCLPEASPRGFLSRLFSVPPLRLDPSRFGTCRYLETVGAETRIPADIARIAHLHDEACEIHSIKPLA